MLEDNQYQNIERYLSNEMTERELGSFEQALKSNPKLAQTLAIYKDMPNQLEGIQGNLDFNHKLAQVAQTYRKSDESIKPKFSPNRWIWIALLAILMSVFIWWKYYDVPVEEPLPSDIPIAALWENTTMPSHSTLRNDDSISQEEQWLEQAFISFETKEYQATITQTDSLSENYNLYPKAQLLQGICYFELENYSKAIDTYNNYLSNANNPRDMALWYLALAQIKTAVFQDAKTTLQGIIKEDYQQAEEAKVLLLQIEALIQ